MAIQGIRSSCEMALSSFAAARVTPVASSKPNSTEGRTAQIYAAIIVGAILTFFFVKKIITVSLVVLPVAAMIYAIYRSSQAGATTGTPKTNKADKAEKAEGSSHKSRRLSETKALTNKVFQSLRTAFGEARWDALRRDVKSEGRISKVKPDTVAWGRIKETGKLYVKVHCDVDVEPRFGEADGDTKAFANSNWTSGKLVAVMKSSKADSSWKLASGTSKDVKTTVKKHGADIMSTNGKPVEDALSRLITHGFAYGDGTTIRMHVPGARPTGNLDG